MPVTSGSIKLAGDYVVPEKYEAAIAAGIRFFVLRYPRRTEVDHAFFGPFDVTANEDFDYRNQTSSFRLRWMTGPQAGVRFMVQPKSEVAVAFMPDDTHYHNRMILAGNRWPIIEGILWQKEGFIGGNRAQIEIECLREVLYHNQKVIRVIGAQSGREIDCFFTEQEADDFITQKVLKFRGGGLIPHEEQPYVKCRKADGEKVVFRPEIMDIMRRHKFEPHGWTANDEFKGYVIPRVDALISKKTVSVMAEKPVTAVDVRQQVYDIIGNMTEAEFKTLQSMRPAQPSIPTPQDIPPLEAPADETDVVLTAEGLEDKPKAELAKMCEAAGIEPKGTKKDMIAALMQASTKPTAQVVLD